MKKSEIILNIITLISILVMLWGFISYIDIVMHNLTTQIYSRYNLFEIIMRNLG